MIHLMSFFDCILGTTTVVVIITIVLPTLFLFLFPILLFTIWVTYQYLRTSRELKRLESIKKSPVFILLTESLTGLPVIRAYQQELRFWEECYQRTNHMNQCHLYLWQCNRWLNFRMGMCGAVTAGVVGTGVVWYTSQHPISAASAGLALLYSLSFCDYLTWIARTHAEVSIYYRYNY
jgi:ABC-type multidrug transport system fused ATPase/permease subunit